VAEAVVVVVAAAGSSGWARRCSMSAARCSVRARRLTSAGPSELGLFRWSRAVPAVTSIAPPR